MADIGHLRITFQICMLTPTYTRYLRDILFFGFISPPYTTRNEGGLAGEGVFDYAQIMVIKSTSQVIHSICCTVTIGEPCK